MGDEKGTKKPKKAKPPKLPGKPPPKEDKAATEKYNALVDFIDCKGNTVSLKAGKLDWLGLDVAPPASFEADPNKPGTINIKVDLGIGTVTLPATVKDGKLEVDTSGLVMGADKVKKFVDDLNNWFEANGKKIDGATIKDGSLVVTKAVVAPPPGKAGEKKEGKGIKGGLFPNVPGREKVGAGILLGLSVLFGVGFMNAGDETETATEQVCPEGTTAGKSVPVGLNCRSRTTGDTPPAPRSEGLAEQISDVVINVEGGQQFPGILTPGAGPTLTFELPLYQIGVPHHVEFRGEGGTVIDRFQFVVPEESGPIPSFRSEQQAVIDLIIDHTIRVLNGNSGSRGMYTQPAVAPTPQPTPDTRGQTVEPVEKKTEQNTNGAPVSLAVPLGAAVLTGGALKARDTCRGDKGKDTSGITMTVETGPFDDGPPPAVFLPGTDEAVDEVM